MNKIFLTGNLVKEPELKRTQSGKAYMRVGIAVQRGIKKDEVDFFDLDTKYFTVTLYKKGTCHLTFKDLNLLKKFNLYCGKRFNWLPDGYGTKPYEDLSDAEKAIADSFEGRESYEETFKNQEFYLPTNQNSLLMLTAG